MLQQWGTLCEIRRSYCGFCHPRCGILLHIENGKVVKVTGDPDHPITRGAICERGRLMLDHIDHPQRLNFPLKRTGGAIRRFGPDGISSVRTVWIRYPFRESRA